MIFIGDVSSHTADLAQCRDANAFLIDYNNCDDFLNSTLEHNTVVYTSLGDLPKNLTTAWTLLCYADTVVYCPVDTWSDQQEVEIIDSCCSLQGLTEHLLLMLPKHIDIENFNTHNLVPDPVPLVDCRKSNAKQLWFVGCSITHGVGVGKRQKFGQLVADELDLPCSFLTRSGSAIDWASDQIVRSDIRSGDVVIWGLTELHRLTYVHNNKLIAGINNQNYNSHPQLEHIVSKKNLVSQNTIYNHLYAIDRAINFCQAVGAKLFIIGLMTSSTSLRYLCNKKEFHQYPYHRLVEPSQIKTYNFEDLGSDQIHPGILQHMAYKNFVLQLISSQSSS